jgi:hypothetical protein
MRLDPGTLNLFIKMISDEYKLSQEELSIISSRLMADEREFEKVWKNYNNKSRRISGGVDPFKFILKELVS